MDGAVLFVKEGCEDCEELKKLAISLYGDVYIIDTEKEYMVDLDAWIMLSYNEIDPTTMKVPLLFYNGMFVEVKNKCKDGGCKL